MLHLFNLHEERIGELFTYELHACDQTEPLNSIVELHFTVQYANIEKMEAVEYVGHVDAINENAFQMYKILTALPDANGMTYTAIHVAHDDFTGYGYVKERHLQGVQAGVALGAALEGSRWRVGTVVPTAAGNVSFYDNSRHESISKILETWDVEIAYRLVFSKNKIIGRYVDLHHQRGVDTGRRYAYGDKALEVVKEESQAGLYTAAIGRGKGEEKYDEQGASTGGFGRRITFTDIVWSKAKGDPVDKPAGQEYVEIPEMTAQFGYSDGSPRMKVCVYQNIEDPTELLKKTYEELLINSRPLVQFKSTIYETGKLELGDRINIIRKDLGIYYKTRVFKVKRDLLSGGMTEIELGDNLSVTQADFNRSLRKDINAAKEDMAVSIGGAVGFMQEALTASMFDDDAYFYRLPLGNEYGLPAGQYTFDRPIDQNPTKAIYFGAGKMAVANKKDSNGNFLWSTWATGDGMVADVITSGTILADLIKAGILSDAAGRNFIDMETGAFNFGDKITYNPATGQFRIDGTLLVSMISGQTGKLPGKNITLDGNTTVLGSFSVPGSSLFGAIDAQTINVRNLNADNLNRGTVGTSISNDSGYMMDGYRSAKMQGSLNTIDGNSQVFYFDYARNNLMVQGRLSSTINSNFHEFQLNGCYVSGYGHNAMLRVTSTGGRVEGTGNFEIVRPNLVGDVFLRGRALSLGTDGNVKWT